MCSIEKTQKEMAVGLNRCIFDPMRGKAKMRLRGELVDLNCLKYVYIFSAVYLQFFKQTTNS